MNLPKTVVGVLVLAAFAHAVAGGHLDLPAAPAAGATAAAGVMSPDQIGAVAGQAGFIGHDRAVAVAVAEAESGGDPGAVGDGGTSFGLWQIHITAHPDVPRSCALEPSCAAAAAFQISHRGTGTDWSPWTTYRTGAYLAFMPAARAGAWRPSR